MYVAGHSNADRGKEPKVAADTQDQSVVSNDYAIASSRLLAALNS